MNGFDAIGRTMSKSMSTTSQTVEILLIVFLLAAMWSIFMKAGEEGWKSLIPFYNIYILFRITWDSGILFLLLFVPVVGVVVYWITEYKLCRAFGKGTLFFIGMLLFMPVFWGILAFGESKYLGPV